jgi:hypothetical protein
MSLRKRTKAVLLDAIVSLVWIGAVVVLVTYETLVSQPPEAER